MPHPLEWRTAYSTIKTCPTLWVTLPHLAALHQMIERELRGEFLQESKTVHSRGPFGWVRCSLDPKLKRYLLSVSVSAFCLHLYMPERELNYLPVSLRQH